MDTPTTRLILTTELPEHDVGSLCIYREHFSYQKRS
jgi:hypothetical protein